MNILEDKILAGAWSPLPPPPTPMVTLCCYRSSFSQLLYYQELLFVVIKYPWLFSRCVQNVDVVGVQKD